MTDLAMPGVHLGGTRETRETYVSALDPEVASLRSMSLASKIRLQKRVQYERNRQHEIENYRGILAGLWE